MIGDCNNGPPLSPAYTPLTRIYLACVILVAFTCLLVDGYETYTVEGECSSGHLILDLKESGPGSALLLHTTDRTSYSVAGECRIEVRTANPQQRIVAVLVQIGFRKRPDGHCKDFVQIEKLSTNMCSHVYGLEKEHHFYSANNSMEILHYVSEDNSSLTGYPGVKLTLTALIPGSKCSNTQDWFRCRNDFCIWSELKCDSHNNCGDRSDEQDCDTSGGGQSTVLIILAGLILSLLLIMCTATLLCSKNETVRRFSNRLRSQTVSYVTRFSR